MRLSRAEIEHLGIPEIMRLQSTVWKENVVLMNADGQDVMVLHWHEAAPPCMCVQAERDWICLHCDGRVSLSEGTDK